MSAVRPRNGFPLQAKAFIAPHSGINQDCDNRRHEFSGAKYRASSFADITRSLCRSPGKSLIFGADGTVPHSNANFNIRRRTRRELLTELTCSFCDSRFAENAAIFSVVISSSLQSASGLKPLMARRLGRYQSSHVFGEDFSNVAWTHGSNRLSMNSARVGDDFFSRMPTSPFASEVRCADSICRATLSLPCFVDSRTSLPCHINLYQ